MPEESKLRPVAFMVMPFGKRTIASPPEGAPAQLDCDALWDRAFRPALGNLGYLPIRADMEVGTVIVKDMLERLALRNSSSRIYRFPMAMSITRWGCVT